MTIPLTVGQAAARLDVPVPALARILLGRNLEQAANEPDRRQHAEPLYYTVSEAARKLGVSARWLADQCRAGRVEHVHLARKRRFTPDQLKRLLESSTVDARRPTRTAIPGDARRAMDVR